MSNEGLIPGVVDPWAESEPTSSTAIGNAHSEPIQLQRIWEAVARLDDHPELGHHPSLYITSSQYTLLQHALLHSSRRGAHGPMQSELLQLGRGTEAELAAGENLVVKLAELSHRRADGRAAVAGGIAGSVTAVGAVLTGLALADSGVRPNLAIALFLAIGGLVLIVTLITALRDR